MTASDPADETLAGYPDELRALVDAERQVGNAIRAYGGTFPAPPFGAWVMLANPVSTRPRGSAPGVQFINRNSSNHAGEFCDPTRTFFVLESPPPPPPPPDMDAIRDAQDARERAANANRDRFY